MFLAGRSTNAREVENWCPEIRNPITWSGLLAVFFVPSVQPFLVARSTNDPEQKSSARSRLYARRAIFRRRVECRSRRLLWCSFFSSSRIIAGCCFRRSLIGLNGLENLTLQFLWSAKMDIMEIAH